MGMKKMDNLYLLFRKKIKVEICNQDLELFYLSDYNYKSFFSQKVLALSKVNLVNIKTINAIRYLTL